MFLFSMFLFLSFSLKPAKNKETSKSEANSSNFLIKKALEILKLRRLKPPLNAIVSGQINRFNIMPNQTDNSLRCSISKKQKDGMKLIFMTLAGTVMGFFLGISFPTLSLTKINFSSNILTFVDPTYVENKTSKTSSSESLIWVPSNPRGAETLPPDIVVAESDLYLRRLWGSPEEDLTIKPKYLVAFTVGYDQRNNIDACVKKFSENFTIVLFHYDGKTSEYDEFEWSKRAIHVSVPKQTKWWYAKRFLHPDIIAAYDYVFIWDEDLGVEHFNAEEYLKIVKKHNLEISQPAVESKKPITWRITKRIPGSEVHKKVEQIPGHCDDPHMPPCAAFIEIMAPVFSRNAWRCTWHMLQNDLVHGWGLDFALRRCVEPGHEKIGVVDSQWIIHQTIPSLGNQGTERDGKPAYQGVRDRCRQEWGMFQNRMTKAEEKYMKEIGSTSNSTLN